MASSLMADKASSKHDKNNPYHCSRFYIGAYGGELFSNTIKVTQMGTALFNEASGGPLAVVARGHVNSISPGFGGLQLGYEWAKCLDDCNRRWNLAPGAELEAYWLAGYHTKGHLMNTTDTHRLPDHDFLDSFRINSGVYLANFLLSLNNNWKSPYTGTGLTPYIGAGVGATRISLHHADSLQVAPPEPGINYFNSSTHDSAWTFAAQIKAGLRYKFNRFHIFGEYRYLFVDFSNYIFGSTVYPTHAHTTPWNVKIRNIHYNGFAFGVQYDL